MPKCTFCKALIEKGTGKIFVHTDGRVAYYCSMKCEKNQLKLKRNPVNIKWTGQYRDEKNLAKEQSQTKKVKVKK